MAGFLPPLGTLIGTVSAIGSAPATTQAGTPEPWRPPQWASGTPALTMTATDPATQQTTAYVFDNVMRIEHLCPTVVTLNPVQTGANISDHSYIVPPRLIVEIGMSDAMQSFTATQWADGPSRSVNAYRTLVAIQGALQPVQLSTRLNDYDTMMIADIRAEDDASTAYGLRAIVTFQQVVTANVETSSASSLIGTTGNPVSADPQTTGQTIIGQQLPQTVPPSIQSQNSISNASSLGLSLSQIPTIAGQGTWSSYPLSGLSTVFPGVG